MSEVPVPPSPIDMVPNDPGGGGTCAPPGLQPPTRGSRTTTCQKKNPGQQQPPQPGSGRYTGAVGGHRQGEGNVQIEANPPRPESGGPLSTHSPFGAGFHYSGQFCFFLGRRMCAVSVRGDDVGRR